MKFYSIIVLIFLCSLTIFSCKKEEAVPKTNEERFIGLWVEKSAQKDTLLVTKGDPINSTGPQFFLFHSGQAALPFGYSFFSNGDSIKISLLTSSDNSMFNVPYKITFPTNQSLHIKRFHNYLPNTNPVVFDKIR